MAVGGRGGRRRRRVVVALLVVMFMVVLVVLTMQCGSTALHAAQQLFESRCVAKRAGSVEGAGTAEKFV